MDAIADATIVDLALVGGSLSSYYSAVADVVMVASAATVAVATIADLVEIIVVGLSSSYCFSAVVAMDLDASD